MPDQKNDMMDFDFADVAPDDLTSKEIATAPEGQMELPMAAPLADFKSDVLTKSPNEFSPCDTHGALRILTFRCEADDNYIGGSTFSLCKLPQSQIRLLPRLSVIEFSDDLNGDLGWTKYKTRRHEQMPLNRIGFNGFFSKPQQSIRLDSLEGMFMIFTANHDGKEGDLIEGYLIYVKM